MKRRATSRHRREAGFTLLELIAVLAIVALAATLAFPLADRSRRGLAVRTAAIDLASALKTARAEAVRSNAERRVVLDLNARQFAADGTTRPHALPREVTVVYDVPVGEQSADGIASIRFRPDGSSSGGTISVAGQRQSASVTVDWLTGRTHITWGR